MFGEYLLDLLYRPAETVIEHSYLRFHPIDVILRKVLNIPAEYLKCVVE